MAAGERRLSIFRAFEAGDPENTAVWFGEAAGLIHSIEPAATILERMAQQAAELITSAGKRPAK